MKNRIITLALLPLLLAACGPTRIVTYSPAPAATHYSTTVMPYRTHTTTTITQVNSTTVDVSLHLDLQAVAALFAQAATVEEFENMLNNGNYPVSNLDLNGDGYIDYLRVLETVDGYNHVFLIQAVLAENVFQDVATIVAETPSAYNYYLEIIGAPYIYGPNFIVRPRFYARPPIFDYLRRRAYHPWMSPWHWGYFPVHYHHPRPIYLNHYQAYVRTYMVGHPYCHEVFYPVAPRYKDYERMMRNYSRNDFGNQHPDRTFTVRNANTPNVGGSGTVRNAYDIRQNNEATKTTRTIDNRSASSVATGRGTGVSSSSTGGSTTRSTGATSTTGSTTRSSGTTSSGSATRSSGTTTTRSTGTTGSATRSTGATSGSATRSTGSSTGTTVTRSRVSSSGSSTTTTSPATTRSSSAGSTTRSSSASSSTTRSSSAGSTTRSSGSTSGVTRSSSSSSSSSATRSSSSSSSSSSRSTGAATSSTSRGRR